MIYYGLDVDLTDCKISYKVGVMSRGLAIVVS